jgi:uncharacterized CHY-type Zn-finger protein
MTPLTGHGSRGRSADAVDRAPGTRAAAESRAAEVADDMVVRGPAIDAETRCIHYGSALDIVALRAPCCDAWYPCHLCHAAVADHPLEAIPRAEHHLPAALCGVCRATMSVPEYLAAESCPSCGAAFNPGCAAHAHLYFAP